MSKRRKKSLKPAKLDPNTIKVRDELVKALICGATKTGIQEDKKKAHDKKVCREAVKDLEE